MADEGEYVEPIEQEHDEEATLVVYDEDDILESVQACENSIIGKLVTNKNINVTWIQKALSNIWRKPAGFRVIEVQPKETDLNWGLKENLWFFRNAWLLVKKWERAKD
ncbi:hypothetical protein Ahy_B05g076156 [Arachis hypogaea]|uniref:DUF4283 domain-containing protein n=1 Tax=Arachis hypogaea TaxID=3818 RepID=A0A444Z2P6_ARAHY|nr:hypothetical protein Ahy_B05g076156 [Arachis hypogaea]